jgi:hypothetical protein
MDIHSLIEKFRGLGNAEIGRGPKSYNPPNLSMLKEIETFLEEYPFLKQDQGYVDFLENYAGAFINWPNEELTIDLFGFDDKVATHIVKEDGFIVDEAGFLCFCDTAPRIEVNEKAKLESRLGKEIFFKDQLGLQYCFDASGKRQPGIYLTTSYHKNKSFIQFGIWYCETFSGWFEALIEKKGQLLQDVINSRGWEIIEFSEPYPNPNT